MTAVLDRGEVRLVDHMASDLKVVGAARVSGGKAPEEASKGEVDDERLIAYLMRNGHGTPWEHAVFQFYVKAPIFVVREWQRHRMASYNEQSGRYTTFEPEFYVPDKARIPNPRNKQSSIEASDEDLHDAVNAIVFNAGQAAYGEYIDLLRRGIAREQARLVLPNNLYTSFWFTVNARSLMNFLMLRAADAAMWEIRQYAVALEDVFTTLMPLTAKAFNDNGRKAP